MCDNASVLDGCTELLRVVVMTCHWVAHCFAWQADFDGSGEIDYVTFVDVIMSQ